MDTIVIGAGWSSAIATRQLASAGRKVLVLEARDRIGGRARTFMEKLPVGVDLGCSWIHGYKEGNPAKLLATQLNIKVHIPAPTDSLIYGPDGPLSSLQAIEENLSVSTAVSAARSFAQSSSTISQTDSLSSFLLKQTLPVNKSLMRTLEIGLGATLEEVSLKWMGWEDNFAGSDAAPEGGYQEFVKKVFTDAQADVKLGEVVTGIEQTALGVKVKTTTSEYEAKTVICTIPLGTMKTLPAGFFSPPLPQRRTDVIGRTHVGLLEKLLLTYPSAWWPSAETAGSIVFLPRTSTSTVTPLAVLNSHTIMVVSFAGPLLPNPHSTLLFYLSAPIIIALQKFSTDDILDAAHSYLVSRFNATAEVPTPNQRALTNWATDPFSLGATTTPSVVGEGRSPLDFAELGKPLWGGRLGFAGEHTDSHHRGSVAGAIISGEREGARVDRLLDLI